MWNLSEVGISYVVSDSQVTAYKYICGRIYQTSVDTDTKNRTRAEQRTEFFEKTRTDNFDNNQTRFSDVLWPICTKNEPN